MHGSVHEMITVEVSECWFFDEFSINNVKNNNETNVWKWQSIDWEQAGQQMNIHDGGKFFVALGEEFCLELYGKEIVEKAIKNDFFQNKVDSNENSFMNAIGDRRQEIVIIGQHLNVEEICHKLDQVLITEEEFQKGPQFYSTMCKDEFEPFTSFLDLDSNMEWETDEEEDQQHLEEDKTMP